MSNARDAGAIPVTLKSPSALVLIAANVVPMAGVLFLGWNIGDVLLLYWGECVVTGLYTLLKIGVVARLRILLLGPFLLIHYGFFMLFCLGLILLTEHEVNKLVTGSYQPQDYAGLAWSLSPALVAFLASHGVSFRINFLGRREYLGRDTESLARELYRRAAPVMGMALLAGVIVSMFGRSGPLLLAVVAIKLAVDLAAHLGEHRRDPS
ncbi:MAG: hypothetical protein IT514_00555 [Burkholderiales bacterium]|nr:hypothetical protein [Burkholderiales bacterium]